MKQFSVFFKNFGRIKYFKENNFYHFYLNSYHPYDGGNNPNFDKFSGLILDLKQNNPNAITYFYNELKNILNTNFTIVAVPPSSPKKISQFDQIIPKLVISNNIVNGLNCLIRTKPIKKLAFGGCRDKGIHLKSICLQNQELIKNQNVLIIDDVRTSGKSLDACEEILMNAKPKLIAKLSLGLTENED